MIQLVTDFSFEGPYVGQMHAVLSQRAPHVPVIDLMHDAPRFNPHASTYLLAALARQMDEGTVCIAVIDPGVGSKRRALTVEADGRWFVGPDNGLFAVLPHVFKKIRWQEIVWRPEQLSNSFHGRDLFAPVGAALALREAEGMLSTIEAPATAPAELNEVIYIDGFGNAMTGIQADSLDETAVLRCGESRFSNARSFSDATEWPFWYRNSLNLVELSLNQGHAADALGLGIGTKISVESCK